MQLNLGGGRMVPWGIRFKQRGQGQRQPREHSITVQGLQGKEESGGLFQEQQAYVAPLRQRMTGDKAHGAHDKNRRRNVCGHAVSIQPCATVRITTVTVPPAALSRHRSAGKAKDLSASFTVLPFLKQPFSQLYYQPRYKAFNRHRGKKS